MNTAFCGKSSPGEGGEPNFSGVGEGGGGGAKHIQQHRTGLQQGNSVLEP